jgi:hypothetical protein
MAKHTFSQTNEQTPFGSAVLHQDAIVQKWNSYSEFYWEGPTIPAEMRSLTYPTRTAAIAAIEKAAAPAPVRTAPVSDPFALAAADVPVAETPATLPARSEPDYEQGRRLDCGHIVFSRNDVVNGNRGTMCFDCYSNSDGD